jgi:parallel beta-helix repeat protein
MARVGAWQWCLILAFLFAWTVAAAEAQVALPGRNVNMAAGTTLPDGDPFLQRQNELSVACSSRDPRTCLAASNDYRTVDVPGLSAGRVVGDAWLGTYVTTNGGQTWRTTLVPGYPQDPSNASPLKGLEAAADPTLRSGTNGMFYLTGIAFNRAAVPALAPPPDRRSEPVKGGWRSIFGRVLPFLRPRDAVARASATATVTTPPRTGVAFVSRYIDDNNADTASPDKVRYLDTIVIRTGTGTDFIDKPTLAVDIPRFGAATCRIPAHGNIPEQSFRGGVLHVAYTVFSSTTQQTRVVYTQSRNCGVSWGPTYVLSQGQSISQGASISIDPRTGAVNVFWRVFASGTEPDAIYMTRSPLIGLIFLPPVRVMRFTATKPAFDQGTLPNAGIPDFRAFRTNALPTAATDENGRTYVAFAQRGWGPASPNQPGDARIVVSSAACNILICGTWSAPAPIDNHPGRGHQFMPALTMASGQLALAWQDQRDDYGPKLLPDPNEGFQTVIADPVTMTPFHTTDVRIAFAAAGPAPAFTDNTLAPDGKPVRPSARVSRYLFGFKPGTANAPPDIRQLEFNAANYPLFVDGTRPFIGDFIDVSSTTPFLPTANGGWAFNLGQPAPLTSVPVPPQVITAWGDNRDVRPPANGDWTSYTPPTSPFTIQQCAPGQEGMRNQNPYSAQVTQGFGMSAAGIAKPVNEIQRAFVVTLENSTNVTRSFQLVIENQPPAPGKASFLQFPASGLPDPLTTLVLNVPPRTTASRSVFVNAPPGNPLVPITVRGSEIGGTLQSAVVLNGDPTNPPPTDAGLLTAEAHDPIISAPIVRTAILSPDFLNPDFLNPDFLNPDFLNPDFLNPDFLNPDFLNPDFLNPDFLNPDFLNPDFLNPDFLNPDFLNAGMTSITAIDWTVSNAGNTTSSYVFRPLLREVPDNVAFILFVTRLYKTPVVENCVLTERTHEQQIAIIANPDFLNPDFLNPDFLNPDFLNIVLNPSATNTTLTIAPAETLRVSLWVRHRPNEFDPSTVQAATVSSAVNTDDTAPCTDNNPATACAPSTDTALTIVLAGLPAALNGSPFSVTAQAAGGPAPFTWSATGLPNGLAMSPTTGQITGVPAAAAGTYSVTVTVTDSTTPTPRSASRVFDLVLSDPVAFAVVTNTNDAGAGSLRAAILQANGSPAVNTIVFNIPGSGVQTITPLSGLGVITDPVVIDGTTQAGYAGAPLIEINGSSAGLETSGLIITAGNSTVKGLIVNRFGGNGIVLQNGGGNTITRTYVGTNATGSAPAGNGSNAILILDSANNVVGGVNGTTPGGPCTGDCNVLVASSTSSQAGVSIDGVTSTGNQILGNFIGLNASGTLGLAGTNDFAIAARADGTIIGDGTAAGRNVVAGNNTGIAVSAATASVRGNYVGTNAAGTAPVPAGFGGYNNVNGGVVLSGASNSTVDGNLISGNDGYGVVISGAAATANVVRGNLIGLSAAGTSAVGNGQSGVLLFNQANNNTIGGTTVAARNIIAGNAGAGVSIGSDFGITANRVIGNFIGTDTSGTGAVPNAAAGVLIDVASSNTIGGTGAGEGNLIAFNGGPGVHILPGAAISNQIAGNVIRNNAGLGIDLFGDGVTANDPLDADVGPNRLQNFPTLTSTSPSLIRGVINSAPNSSFRIEFFANAGCVPDGEGESFLGSLTVATDGSGSSATFSFAPSAPLAIGMFVTATATDLALNDTSEFSACLEVSAAAPSLVVTNTADSGPGSLRQAMLDAEGSAGPSLITFSIPGSGPHTITVGTFPLPPITPAGGAVTIDGTTQPGYVGDPIVELDGASVGVLTSSGLVIAAGNSTVRGLMINRFPDSGIRLSGNGNNKIEGNWIGVGPGGMFAKGNLNVGVGAEATSNNNIIGGTTASARNVISGNNTGVLLWNGTTGNQVQGNYIGTDKVGTGALGNRCWGVKIENASNNTVGGTTSAARNVISGNGAGCSAGGFSNVLLAGTSNTVNHLQGNYIGLGATGAALGGLGTGVIVSGSNFFVGGTAVGSGNVISNNSIGVQVEGDSNTITIEGNFIGTNATGTADMGNTGYGIVITNTAHDIAIGLQDGASQVRNVISGNDASGVLINGVSNISLQRNRIGTTANGGAALANTGHGVFVTGPASNVTIGGTISDDANRIAFNGSLGIGVTANGLGAPTGVNVTENDIYQNGGLGIDLHGAGVTPNDAGDGDSGPNGVQNFPVISNVFGGVDGSFTLSLNSTPDTVFTIRVFVNTSCNAAAPNDYGEGEIFILRRGLVTSGAGNGSFVQGITLASGTFLTATATGPTGTSEFSQCVVVP